MSKIREWFFIFCLFLLTIIGGFSLFLTTDYTNKFPEFGKGILQPLGIEICHNTPLGCIRMDIAFPLNRRRHIDNLNFWFISPKIRKIARKILCNRNEKGSQKLPLRRDCSKDFCKIPEIRGEKLKVQVNSLLQVYLSIGQAF